MTDWKHPTGKAPKNVVLICLGESTRNDYIGGCMERDSPQWLLDADERWTLNRGTLIYRHDLAFALDYLDGESAFYPAYAAQLWNHDKPLITSHAEGWPNHIHEYPFKEMWNWLIKDVKPNHQDWLINSVPLIAIYAAMIGVQSLTIFGADYTLHNQKEDGAANLAYWAGVLERVGMTIKAPDSSQLLGANQRGFVYGYHPDADPRPAAVERRARFLELINKPVPE